MHLMGGDYLTSISLSDGQQPFFRPMAVGKSATPAAMKPGHGTSGPRMAQRDAKRK